MKKVHTGSRASAVTVLYSSATRLSTAGVQAWSQDSRGISGRGQREDFFGADLATRTITSSGRDDLAIAAPNEVPPPTPIEVWSTYSPVRPRAPPRRAARSGRCPNSVAPPTFPTSRRRPARRRLRGWTGQRPVRRPPDRHPGRCRRQSADFGLLLYGSPTGISRHDTMVSNNGFAAADFDTCGPSGFADLVTVGTDANGVPVLDVYWGQAAGPDQQNGQRFTLTDLGLPDDPGAN